MEHSYACETYTQDFLPSDGSSPQLLDARAFSKSAVVVNLTCIITFTIVVVRAVAIRTEPFK